MAYQPLPSPSSGFHHTNSPFGDTTFTKIFVGGLAWETQSETLRRHFDQFGEILEAVVITDKNTGRSKGYGFVTFRDLEAARRASADPAPIIDGRRANCNLASLGRPRPPLPYGIIPNIPGPVRPASPYVGGFQSPRRTLGRTFSYQQQFPYSYQHGPMHPSYGIAAYGPEYFYPQGAYSPYLGQQQYLQLYGVPSNVNTGIYPYGQLGQTTPSGHGYSTFQGYSLPRNQAVQFGVSNVSPMTTSPLPPIQAPYPAGTPNPVSVQPHLLVPAPRFMQGSSDSDQSTGLQRERPATLLLKVAGSLAANIVFLAFQRSQVVRSQGKVRVALQKKLKKKRSQRISFIFAIDPVYKK